MYLVWINPPINFTFSDDSVFLKKNLGGGHKFSEFACLICISMSRIWLSIKAVTVHYSRVSDAMQLTPTWWK